MVMKDLTRETLESTILTGTVLVDFWAPWCGPCRQQLAVLDRIAPRLPDDVVIGKVNVDDEPALAEQFGVRSIPTLLLFRNGERVETLRGLTPDARLLSLLGLASV